MRRFINRSPLIIFFIFLVTAATLIGATNKVQNPGFEQTVGNLPSDWSVAWNGIKGDIVVSTQLAESGTNTIRISPSAANTSVHLSASPLGLGQGFLGSQFSGNKLYLTALLAAEGEAKAVVALYAIKATGGAERITLTQAASSQMVHHRDVFTVSTSGPVLYYVLLCLVDGTSGSAYFDDLWLSDEMPADWQTEPPLPNPGPTGDAQVTVDAANIIRDIPPTLFGQNLEWVWGGNGVWNVQTSAPDTTLTSLTQALGTKLFRYPGGIMADYYHWRDGIGPLNQRPAVATMPGGAVSVPVFGTDEAIAFAEHAGGELLITVNAGTGTAKEAADWVSYANRNGLKVKYWEIGNELYVRGGNAANNISMTPDEYANTVLEFARAMRAVDSAIKIGAICSENYGLGNNTDFPTWTEDVLRIAGSEVDFIAVHNAYAPAIGLDLGWTARTVYRAQLAAPLQISSSLADISRAIDALGPPHSDRIKIAVTEWGPYFEITPNGRFAEHTKTLGSAIYSASALKALIESPKTEIATSFQLVDGFFLGWIGRTSGGSVRPKAPYYSFQMFTRHFGQRLISTNVVSPTFGTTSVGWVAAEPQVPYIEAVSSLSNDGQSLYVIAINKSFDNNLVVDFSIQNFAGGASVDVVTLTGAGVDAHTGTEPPLSVVPQAGDEIAPRINLGNPSEITLTSDTATASAGGFYYDLPPLSVTSFRVRKN